MHESIDDILKIEGYVKIKQDETLAGFYDISGDGENDFLNQFTRVLDRPRPVIEPVSKTESVATPTAKSASVRSAAYDIESVVDQIKWHMDRVSKYVIGREEVIRQIMFAIITGEHVLLLSRTGMAKSFLANHVFSCFEGARVFSSQASKDQTPDNYFGPYNIEEFKRGRIRHNIKGSIIEANLVFLDEFFDASDVVLRSLLSVLNERKFINGAEQIDVAIHSAIATANYMRLNEVTEAILDRFTYKAILNEDNNVYWQMLIDKSYQQTRGEVPRVGELIPFDQMQYLNEIINDRGPDSRVVLPDTMSFIKNIVINRYTSEMRRYDPQYFVSPRKQAKVVDFLKAHALLEKRSEVTFDDLQNMYIPLCTLNGMLTVKGRDKAETEVFNDAYQQALVHMNASGALQQVEFLLNTRSIFQKIKDNPAESEQILKQPGLLEGMFNLLKKIFPSRFKGDESELTLETLKRQVSEMQPAVEEVRELRDGIVREYWGL